LPKKFHVETCVPSREMQTPEVCLPKAWRDTEAVDYLRARKPVGGFLFVTVTQLAMVWWAYRRQHIQLKDLRVWFGALELVARRCGLKNDREACYGTKELRTLVAGRGGEEASIKRLEAVGLLSWSETDISFATEVSEMRVSDVSSLHEMLSQIQNHRRKVPVPRQVVRLIASPSKRCVIATLLGHLMRCLYYRSGECISGGFCKASWVAEVFTIDLRNVKASRKFLAETLGLLERVPLPQSLCNRYGQKVIINLTWNGAAVDKSNHERSGLPPLEAQTDTGLPPLEEHTKPLREHKHQKPAAGGTSTGVLEPSKTEQPALRHIVPDDLTDTGRLLILFDEAQARGLIGGSESERLTFVATAERARLRAITNAPGLFAELVRRRLWHFVTQDDEDRAHRRLREHCYGRREAGRPPALRRPAGALSQDALFVADVSARLSRQGFTGEVFAAVSQALPEWTRDRWEHAMAELSARTREKDHGVLQRMGDFSLLETIKVR
jgi:hypothetical protein